MVAPNTSGTNTSGAPEEMTSVTVDSGSTRVPASGSVLITIPSGTVDEASRLGPDRRPEVAKALEGVVVVETCQVRELEFFGTLGHDEIDRGPRRLLDPRQGGLLDDLADGCLGVGTRRHGSHGQARSPEWPPRLPPGTCR